MKFFRLYSLDFLVLLQVNQSERCAFVRDTKSCGMSISGTVCRLPFTDKEKWLEKSREDVSLYMRVIGYLIMSEFLPSRIR